MRFTEPKVGTTIWKKKFAWFKIKIGTTTIWLESYYVKNVYFRASSYPKATWNETAYLPEDEPVKTYLLSISPLGKTMKED